MVVRSGRLHMRVSTQSNRVEEESGLVWGLTEDNIVKKIFLKGLNSGDYEYGWMDGPRGMDGRSYLYKLLLSVVFPPSICMPLMSK